MKLKLVLIKAIGIVVAAIPSVLPATARAQVWANGPNGAGYISTPMPISPDCIPPQIWTLTNGHYSCQNPPLQAAPTPPAQNIPPVPVQDEENACTVAYEADRGRKVGPGTWLGPYTGSGLTQFNNAMAVANTQGLYPMPSDPEDTYGNPGTPVNSNDMFLVSPVAFCWVQPGTTNVTGVAVLNWCGDNTGTVQCSGGGYGN